MDEIVKSDWLQALRHGGYSQGTACLETARMDHDGNMIESTENSDFCCLGVLCDLAVKQNVCERRFDNYGNVYYGLGDFNPANPTCAGEYRSDVLPTIVVEWAGFVAQNPSVKTGESEQWVGYDEEGHYELSADISTLADLNDNGSSFLEIADYIEQL